MTRRFVLAHQSRGLRSGDAEVSRPVVADTRGSRDGGRRPPMTCDLDVQVEDVPSREAVSGRRANPIDVQRELSDRSATDERCNLSAHIEVLMHRVFDDVGRRLEAAAPLSRGRRALAVRRGVA